MIKTNLMVGNNKGVTVCEFGKGDIGVASAKLEDIATLCLYNTDKKYPLAQEINHGAKTTEDTGLNVLMVFDKIESIDVLIEKLNECKEILKKMNYENNNNK